MAFNKVGFLASDPPGNADGIGAYVRTLDRNNIPAVVMCNDGMIGIGDVLTLDTDIPHVMLYRIVKDGSEYWSVPDYSLEPHTAALAHWSKLEPEFHPLFKQHKDRIWLAPINEPDKNRASWLGQFALEFAKLAKAAGYKVAMFGWSTGEPEPDHWLEPGMVAYLEYCAANPDTAAVCLHEYSLDLNNILAGNGWLVGRFTKLFDACAQLGIARPKVIIGEFGWLYNNVPDPATAIQHIDLAAALYAKYDAVLGAGIWYLGKGFDNIAQKAQQLIEPVTTLTLSKTYPGEDPPPTTTCLPPRLDYARTYVYIHESVPDDKAAVIALDAFEQAHTVGFAADDAGLGAGCLTVRSIKAYGVPEAEQPAFVAFWDLHYPGCTITFIAIDPPPPPPTPSNVLFGLHATADPTMAPGELAVFDTAQPELIKVLSNIDPNHLALLAVQHPKAVFIVRAFLDFGNRHITPTQFVNDTLPDVQRSLNVLRNHKTYVELHNEPNLVQEGLQVTWSDGTAFNIWFLAVLDLYRAALPKVPMLYPGLSPGPSIPGVRQDHLQFIQQSRQAVLSADGLGVHVYWALDYPMAQSIAVMRQVIEQFPTKPFFVTEASNNKLGDPVLKGFEYMIFWVALKNYPMARGVTYFVASASNPLFSQEVWVKNGQSTGIAEVVATRYD